MPLPGKFRFIASADNHAREPIEQTELLVDTHVHTHYSDGLAGVPRIERFCRDRGLGVAVTDHNEIRGSTSMFERERVPVIPGIEVGTEEGVDLAGLLFHGRDGSRSFTKKRSSRFCGLAS